MNEIERPSYFERILTGIILEHKWLGQLLFWLDRLLAKNPEKPYRIVFITGMARAGSTLLLKRLSSAKGCVSPCYRDMPFFLAPSFWRLFQCAWSFLSGEYHQPTVYQRSHMDGVQISLDSPESFDGIYWRTFGRSEESAKGFYELAGRYVSRSAEIENFIVKNNSISRDLSYFSKWFPDGVFLICVREPFDQCVSLLRQHTHFLKEVEFDPFVGKYHRWLGHCEFGPEYVFYEEPVVYGNPGDINHWIEQWCFHHSRLLSVASQRENVHFIEYRETDGVLAFSSQLRSVLGIDASFHMDPVRSYSEDGFLVSKELLKNAREIFSEMICFKGQGATGSEQK